MISPSTFLNTNIANMLDQTSLQPEDNRVKFVALSEEDCDSHSKCFGYSMSGDYLIHEGPKVVSDAGEVDKWNDNYLELDFTLNIGEMSDKNRFMLSFGL